MDVTELVSRAGASPSAFARETGLSRATIHRVRDGVTSPSLATLRELALAQGYDVDLEVAPASDPDAAVAARALLDPTFEGTRIRPEVRDWMKRLQRWTTNGDPEQIMQRAGAAANPRHRKGARHFAPRPEISQERLVRALSSAGAHAGAKHALSGIPAAALYLGKDTRGVTVLWTEDAARAAAGLRQIAIERDHYQAGGILVAPTRPEYFIDAIARDGTTIVAPIQAALDLHGIGLADAARAITKDW